MRALTTVILLGLAPLGSGAQETTHQTNQAATALAGWEKLAGPSAKVVCKPAFYRRLRDGLLVPAEDARRQKDLRVDGVVLEIVEPHDYARRVLAFHFDSPEEWDHWYKPDLLYTGVVRTGFIGKLAFMCDPGWRAVTNGVPGAPNMKRNVEKVGAG